MSKRPALTLALFAILCCCGQALVAADVERVRQKDVDRVAKPLIVEGWCTGMVVGVLEADGTTRVFGYGVRSSGDPRVPDGQTVYEIGSITKAFTGVLLADMAGKGEVALDDPVQKFLPDTVKVPTKRKQAITLQDLSTHASGLPRLPPNLMARDLVNPYAAYTLDDLYAGLAKTKLAHKPGESYDYSNFGVGLLGEALARKAGTTYRELLTERVLEPLEMGDTHFVPTDEQKARYAPAHNVDGDATPNWDWGTLHAAGALRSTADDLLKFVAANVNAAAPAPAPGSTPLGNAMALAYTPRFTASEANDVGLGWHVARKDKVVWHNGGTGGYNAYCAFVPDKNVGVVVLVNTFGDCADLVGYSVMQRLLGNDDFTPPAKPKIAEVEPDALDALVGRYAILPGFSLTVTREDDRLYCQATGQPKFRIYPESATEFFYKLTDAKLTFKLNKDGQAFMLLLTQNGLKLPGIKANDNAATTMTTTTANTKPVAQ